MVIKRLGHSDPEHRFAAEDDTLNALTQDGIPQKIGSAVDIFPKINSLTACVNTSGDEVAGKKIDFSKT
nr:unnamed protein product [Callosobruchus analis]